MKIYVRKNGFDEPKAFLTKAAAFDVLRGEIDTDEVVEAFAFVLGGVQHKGLLEDMIDHIDLEYRDLVIDDYIEHFFDEEFDEYEVADPEDIDELTEEL